jgi:hypothetical protein
VTHEQLLPSRIFSAVRFHVRMQVSALISRCPVIYFFRYEEEEEEEEQKINR